MNMVVCIVMRMELMSSSVIVSGFVLMFIESVSGFLNC